GFDVVVLGHATIEHYARMRGSRFIPSRVRTRLLARHRNLWRLRLARAPKVLFTKNDYKHFDIKNAFIRLVRPNLVVTQHKSALTALDAPPGVRLVWLPFGVDTHEFAPPGRNTVRTYAVGFRANANSEWNGGLRERFFRAL